MDEQLPAVPETLWDEEQATGRQLRRPPLSALARSWRETNAARLNEAFEAAGGQARLNHLMHNQFDKLAPRFLMKTLPQQVNHAHGGVVRVIHVPLTHNAALDGEIIDADATDATPGGSRISDALIAATPLDAPDPANDPGI